MNAFDEDDDIHTASIEYSIYSNNASTITDLFGISKDLGEIYLKKSVSLLGKFFSYPFKITNIE